MLFNSALFLLFLTGLLAVYALVGRAAARKWVLLAASYLFYASWDYRYLSLLLLSTGVDYLVGRRLHGEPRAGRRRLWLLASLGTNLGILAVFKYGNFVLDSAQAVWPGLPLTVPRLPGEIPVGVSFYTFQTLSYTIDLYRRRREPCASPLDFALYVAFFAQLVAGPIVRSDEFLPQVRRLDGLRLDRLAGGAERFLVGLFKKVVIADNAGAFVDAVFAAPAEHSGLTLLGAAYAFAIQIYCDFSGYTDMALGLGRAFGIELPENFRAPYLSASVTEFWRRWHLSLSRWLRDYLYIPLGGSRRAPLRTYANLMVTMLLGGLWHGAAWTFVAWGGLHGALLAAERRFGWRTEPGAPAGGWTGALRRVVTLHLVCLGWILFRSTGFAEAGTYLGRLLTDWSWTGQGELQGLFWAAVLALTIVAERLESAAGVGAALWRRLPAPARGFALASLVLAVAYFRLDQVAFIYFQF